MRASQFIIPMIMLIAILLGGFHFVANMNLQYEDINDTSFSTTRSLINQSTDYRGRSYTSYLETSEEIENKTLASGAIKYESSFLGLAFEGIGAVFNSIKNTFTVIPVFLSELSQTLELPNWFFMVITIIIGLAFGLIVTSAVLRWRLG